jgi:hypothetical protein
MLDHRYITLLYEICIEFSTLLISHPPPLPPPPTNAKGNHLYVLTLSLFYKACCVYKVDGIDICHTILQQRVIYLNTNVPSQLIGIASY